MYMYLCILCFDFEFGERVTIYTVTHVTSSLHNDLHNDMTKFDMLCEDAEGDFVDNNANMLEAKECAHRTAKLAQSLVLTFDNQQVCWN